MKKSLIILTTFFIIFSYTFPKDLIDQCTWTKNSTSGDCSSLNLTGANLAGSYESGVVASASQPEVSYTSFNGAILDKAYIGNNLFSSVPFKKTNFTGASMKGFYMGQTLYSSYKKSFSNNFSAGYYPIGQKPSASFTGAVFNNTDITGAKFYNTNMQPEYNKNDSSYYIDFMGASFQATKATGEQKTYFGKSNFTGANFNQAQFTNVDFGALGSTSVFEDAMFNNSQFKECSFNGASFIGVVKLIDTTFSACTFEKAQFAGANLGGIDFSAASSGTTAQRPSFAGASFAPTTGGMFSNGSNAQTKYLGTILTGTNFSNVDLSGANLVGAQMDEKTTFYNASLLLAQVDNAEFSKTNVFCPHDKPMITPFLTTLALETLFLLYGSFEEKSTTEFLQEQFDFSFFLLMDEIVYAKQILQKPGAILSDKNDTGISESITALQNAGAYDVKTLVNAAPTVVLTDSDYGSLLQLALYIQAKKTAQSLIAAGADLTTGIKKDTTTQNYFMTDSSPLKMLIEQQYDKDTISSAAISWTKQLMSNKQYSTTDRNGLMGQFWELAVGSKLFPQPELNDLGNTMKNMSS